MAKTELIQHLEIMGTESLWRWSNQLRAELAEWEAIRLKQHPTRNEIKDISARENIIKRQLAVIRRELERRNGE